MASNFDVLQLTEVNSANNPEVETSASLPPLPMLSISRVFKQTRVKDFHSQILDFNALEDAMDKHDMDLIKHQLLCNCPLQPENSMRYMRQGESNPLSDPEKSESTGKNLDLLCLASTYGRTDIVYILLNRLKQENIEPEELFDLTYSLHQACRLNNKDIVEKLLKEGATPWEKDEYGFSAMHYAAFSGSLEVLMILIENNGSIHARTDDERTPLHLAARKGYSTVVEFLLCNKASTHVKDVYQCTPLHYACASGVDNVVLLLLRNKCPVDQTNFEGETGLYIAATKGRASIIPILISFGASIDVRCRENLRTPLMVASEHGHVSTIMELVTSGASFHCTDSKRNSALEIALDNGRDSAAALLILRESPYMDYVHEYIRTQEYALCKVVKQKLLKSTAALLDRMVIPDDGSTSQFKVMLKYLDTDISNNLPGESGFLYSKPYFVKLIADNRLEDLAYHGTVRLYVKQQMNKFGRYFLFYKTVLFLLFLFSMFTSFVVVAGQENPNEYRLDAISVLRGLAEFYVVCFWFSNVITEITEIVEIMKRTSLYLKHKRELVARLSTKQQAEEKYASMFSSPHMMFKSSPEADDDPPPEDSQSKPDQSLYKMKDMTFREKLAHFLSNIFITRFLIDYFSDNFNWFDQGGLISLFITVILRGLSSPIQWIFMPVTFVLNCMRIFKLFNVYYSFGTYIRILASVTFFEIPPFLLFFWWTLFVFSGAYFVSLRLPVSWTCPNATDCRLDALNPSMYSEGYDDRVWYSALLGLRVLLEQSPVFADNYIVRLNWFSVFIFLVFVFITSVIYLNLLIAQLTDRYSKVKKVALKVVAWYRLNFIIQSQDTSLIARFYNFRHKQRTEYVSITTRKLKKYYGVDGIDEFVERGSLSSRDYLPEVDNEQLLQHQRYSSRIHELNENALMRDSTELRRQIAQNNEKLDNLATDMNTRYSSLNTKMDDITRLLTSLINKPQ
ncbi:hypothetical protein LOD99_5 [Oopsacas minuta]|uniref:Ion transport domain-containing protein n=1 Tax=Oopsacas minuta TaxID=111878 RepID=A0AAV7K811_9METZ|nr:hypothetical protein LOD99_5 [Oopsacas minuta]